MSLPAMQSAKRRNSGDLILCGAPAKKVPEPPVSHDDPNQSALLRAFEAIVAAGRRGLLGPTARAAAEAAPDVDLGGSEGEAGPETSSPVPAVEEKEGEEEEEKALPDADLGGSEGKTSQEPPSPVEEKKGEWEEGEEEWKMTEKKKKGKHVTIFRHPPPAHGNGSWKSCGKEIWIFGDSVISLLACRAQEDDYLIQLDVPSCITCATLRGFPDMMWNDLLPIVHNIYHKRPFPSIIIIHLGEKDLRKDSSGLLVTKMQNDLGLLQRALPGVVLIWSSLLPKPFCEPHKKSQDTESKRSHVNSKMEEYCTENGIWYLSHPLFTVENRKLFLHDNRLTNEGADIFETDLKEILHTALSRKKC